MGISTSGRINHTGLIQPGLSMSEKMVNTGNCSDSYSAHRWENTDVNPWFSININVEVNSHKHQHT